MICFHLIILCRNSLKSNLKLAAFREHRNRTIRLRIFTVIASCSHADITGDIGLGENNTTCCFNSQLQSANINLKT